MPRKSKSQDGNPYEVIRCMWEGVYVSHFIRLFRKKFGFTFVTTQDLEEALVEKSFVLADICARLLRFLTGNRNILIANFDTFLRNLLLTVKADVPRFLDNGTTWHDLIPEEKLFILKWLVDHVHKEKEEDLADYLDENYEPDDLRGICAGHDAFNNVYWYLDDLRLYREITKKHNKKEWECVCLNIADWYSFLKQFRKTTNVQEKELYTYLNFELFPIIEVELLAKSKTVLKDKEKENISLVRQEQEELGDMLEKKTFLECSSGMLNSLDVNGTDSSCRENHNGAIDVVKCSSEESILEDLKTEETKPIAEENHCDGNLTAIESIGAINNNCSATEPKMDVQNNVCPNSTCLHSCPSLNTDVEIAKACGANETNCSNSVVNMSAGSTCRESVSDVSLQQPSSDNPSDSCSVVSNKENAPPRSASSETDIPPMSAMTNMVGSTSTPVTASVQPLPSNMVNKTSFPLETQYMQQQSQIFVFSTELANKAAESCLSGHFPSIIAFHCAQPGTKSFLEKYPLKVQQFNRQSPATWLNSLASMKHGNKPIKGNVNQFAATHGMSNRFVGPSNASGAVPCMGSCNVHSSGMCSIPQGQGQWPNVVGGNNVGPGIPEMCAPSGSQSWSHQHFGSNVNARFANPSQGMNVRQVCSGNSMLSCSSNVVPNMGRNMFQDPSVCSVPFSQSPGGPSSLTGVKVPDENLTPEQRQHREEQLATIRKMQQMLFPEHQQLEQTQSGMTGPQGNMNLLPTGMLPHGPHSRCDASGDCSHPDMDNCFSPHHSCLNDHDHSHSMPEMFMNSGVLGCNVQNFPPVSVAAQLKWQELQHQFYEERRKKHSTCNVLSHPSVQGQQMQSQQQVTSQQPSVQNSQHPPQPRTPVQQPLLNSPSPNMGLSPGSRMQGPPPPYHQTPRRGISSPHPASPNPSSLSLPSPRMVSSGLSSPADSSRHFPHPTPPGQRLSHPSPGTNTPAGSNSLHTTPLNSPKPLNSSSGPGSNSGSLIKTPTTPSNSTLTPAGTPTGSCVGAIPNSGPSTPSSQCVTSRKQGGQPCNEMQDASSSVSASSACLEFNSTPIPVSTTNTVQDLYCSGSQCTQQCSKPEHCSASGLTPCHKEPSLMPVPSPQQIQYLNAFDGQELTIQKQPNTSIRDIDILSPSSVPPSVIINSGSHSHFQSPDAQSFPNTPGSCSALENSQDSIIGRYPASATASGEGSMQRFSVASPQISTFETVNRHKMPTTQTSDNLVSRFPSVQPEIRLSSSHSNLSEHGVRFSCPTQQSPIFSSGQAGSMDALLRFPGNIRESVQRFHSPSPQNSSCMENMHARFVRSGPQVPTVENIPHSAQYNNIRHECLPSHSYSNPAQMSSNNSPCANGNFASENMRNQSHLHNLQKMTPPFDNVGNKVSSEGALPAASCPANPSVVNSAGNTSASYSASSPLTPSQVTSSQRLTHFDPIASMAAMSESTGPLAVTSVGNVQVPRSLATTSVNISDVPLVSDPEGNTQVDPVNFNSGIQPSRVTLQSPSVTVTSSQCSQYNISPQIVQNIGCGSQAMNSSYVGTSMCAQQLNVQNVATMPAFSAGIQTPGVNPHVPMHNHHPVVCQESGTNTLSWSVTTNHPIVHSSVSLKSSNVNMNLSGPKPSMSFPGQSVMPRNVMSIAPNPSMMMRAPGNVASSFNSTNIQVKASAPNTIQYLPARPQNATIASSRPPSLEFLQRFAAPLTNLDNKVPTHNLQYFPNRGSGPPSIHGPTITPSPGSIGPGLLSGQQRPVNMVIGPMMRGASPISHPGSQMFPVAPGLSTDEPSIFCRPHCAPGAQVNSIASGHNVSIFPNKQMPLSMAGMAPDATQPLPPSMGQTFNYKQSPFCGPTTADPNYAAQFHNFQQQLYATNTRGSQISSQNNVTGQGFFGPK